MSTNKRSAFKHTPIPHRTKSCEPLVCYTLDINSKQITVSEEVYRAYKRLSCVDSEGRMPFPE